MESNMPGLYWEGNKTNEWIMTQTKVRCIVVSVKTMWTWAGCVSRMTGNRWIKSTAEMKPRDCDRTRGRSIKDGRKKNFTHLWSVT